MRWEKEITQALYDTGWTKPNRVNENWEQWQPVRKATILEWQQIVVGLHMQNVNPPAALQAIVPVIAVLYDVPSDLIWDELPVNAIGILVYKVKELSFA